MREGDSNKEYTISEQTLRISTGGAIYPNFFASHIHGGLLQSTGACHVVVLLYLYVYNDAMKAKAGCGERRRSSKQVQHPNRNVSVALTSFET